eukprot:TRINITY_DN75928_c0_g1_i1.p1 TRINITY_DN75928_c0_g1~~TRINITY_DN75928_c0_g1_i1.p1  ORF type:complete len:391 (-),score=22.18 TRINITY_DN75928_c0_g1_i1:52-1065(-)
MAAACAMSKRFIGDEGTEPAGEAPLLVLLCHANGFCRQMFEPLLDDLAILNSLPRTEFVAFDFQGHGDTELLDTKIEWVDFTVADILGVLSSLSAVTNAGQRRRVMGVGHSFGGAGLLMTAARFPDLFERLILYEPVVFVVPRVDNEIMAAAARRRRDRWNSREHAYSDLIRKPVFARFDPRAMRAYVNGGMRAASSQLEGASQEVTLKCPREVEASIFQTSPQTPWGDRSERRPVSGVFADGFNSLHGTVVNVFYGQTTTSLFAENSRALACHLPNASVQEFADAGHLGPFEKPRAFARAIVELLSATMPAVTVRAAGDTGRRPQIAAVAENKSKL